MERITDIISIYEKDGYRLQGALYKKRNVFNEVEDYVNNISIINIIDDSLIYATNQPVVYDNKNKVNLIDNVADIINTTIYLYNDFCSHNLKLKNALNTFFQSKHTIYIANYSKSQKHIDSLK